MSKVLLVCTANICRSPYAAALLVDSLSAEPLPEGVLVASAGTKAREGARLCAQVSRALEERFAREAAVRGASMHQASTHHAEAVSAEDLESADLILTMELSHRARLARTLPAARQRTFTLLEALALAPYLERPYPERLTAGAPESREEQFRSFVAQLNSLRGHPLPSSSAPWWKRSTTDPFDIPDGHISTRRRHRLALRQVSAAAAGLAGVLRPFCN